MDMPTSVILSLPESILVAAFTLTMVFALLACLYILVRVFSIGVAAFGKKTAEAEPQTAAVPTHAAPIAEPGGLKLVNVDEPTAAMIMAIVSDESGIPLDELQFKSIKAL